MRQPLRTLVGILVMLAVAFGPFATLGAVAMPAKAGMAMAGMAMDTPCPLSKKSQDCDKDCPLMVLCLVKCFQTASSAESVTLHRDAVIGELTMLEDAWRDGLRPLPPPRPPRTLF